MQITVTALLLVGGLSRRMGRDKATLVIEGEPLWARQLSLLRDLKPAALWVSARTPPGWLPPDAELILDAPPSRGPLSGIAAALDRMHSSHLLALAVDLPRMTTAHLRKIAGMANPACGVIPRNQDCLEPLAAIYPKQALSPAQSALTSQDFSMRSFAGELLRLELLRDYVLSCEEQGLYQNLNTTQDLE
jgi:molybdopterin-guanine dinucleotide biosynthesis protein A